uniref:Sphingomyelin phosphodiesterase 4-like isoform X2 n=2 Tax=Hirondellea gigas TaxID=1518452 RepID=A0A6A7FTK8_9CRUS
MSEHIRAVRMIIKHFHYFSNSIKPAQPSPLDNLRRSLWSMCRVSFYRLFVQLLARWPLDSSFRLLLEAWLSYIQPWRYTDINRPSDAAEGGGGASPVEWQWQRFVADNLLLYSSILNLVLPRLLRLDLSAPKNAHMLYRISKVLSLPNLSSLLKATEESLQCSPHTLLPQPPPSVQPPEGGQLPHQVAALAARTHIVEMEGNNYIYVPIFGLYTENTVRQVLCNVRSADLAVQSELEAAAATKNRCASKGGVLCWVRDAVSWLESAVAAADSSTDELQRTLLHLTAAAQHLHHLFQISESSVISASTEESPSKRRSAVPDQVKTANGMVLTDEGRRQLVSGLRRKDLKYEGDPDLRPISFGELTLLVRWLYSLATFLNNKYSSSISSGYYSSGIAGLLWRCVLQPPLTVYEYQKHGSAPQNYDNGGSFCHSVYPTKRARQLPPRLSFRRAANRQVLLCAVLLSVALRVFGGVSLSRQFMYLALPALLLYFSVQLLLCRTVLRPPPRPASSPLH